MIKWLIVGLGNPGLRYRNTRHNGGWWAVDRLAKSLGVRIKRNACGAKVIRIEDDDTHLTLAKPLSFMNRSGIPVDCLLKAYEISFENLIVIFDDIDLPVGALRVKRSGASGGHKGITSIITETGMDDFYRIKMGIGRPEDRDDVVEYVLSNPPPDEKKILMSMADLAVSATKTLIDRGFQRACNEFNDTNPNMDE
jgi:peptidyl-tRNA hydrolase, PTH1 family